MRGCGITDSLLYYVVFIILDLPNFSTPILFVLMASMYGGPRIQTETKMVIFDSLPTSTIEDSLPQSNLRLSVILCLQSCYSPTL